MVLFAKKLFQSLQKRFKTLSKALEDSLFLSQCRGVVHVGANSGQEAKMYNRFGLNVLWVEPIEDIVRKLKINIQKYKRQVAVRALVTDKTGINYDFHIANNGGASSSILKFDKHKDIWPEVTFEKTIQMRSTTLPDLLEQLKLNLKAYDCLILDTQGTELLVLKGASSCLQSFRFIKVEAADFESYQGCCTDKDISDFLKEYKFKELRRKCFARHRGGGSYYDIIFKRFS